MSVNSDVGIDAREQEVSGFSFKNCDYLYWKLSWSVAVMHLEYDMLRSLHQSELKRQHKRCTTIISFEDPW